jgi:DNA mismatch repair protein MutS
MLIDDYFTYQIDYQHKYGNKTIVLMQVGSFFEAYGVDNYTEKIGDLQRITELLNIQLTRRNKAILENSRSNALMCGFPTNSLKRFINILLNTNYTIVLIEQTTPPPNPERIVTQIYSPGTYIDEINQSDSNNMVSLYITEDNCHKTGLRIFSFGISSVDLSTGYNTVYEGSQLYYEKNAFFEEIYRFIEANNPKELVITVDLSHIKPEELKMRFNNTNRVLHIHEKVDAKFTNLGYQNSFLKKIFQRTGLLTPIEYINIEKNQYALISYIILLQFAYEHNERIIEKISVPVHWMYDDHLILYNNAIYQLNIVDIKNSNSNSDSHNKSLYDLLQKTSTNMGKRLLKYRMSNPITSVTELNKRYDLINIFGKYEKLGEIEGILNEIIDIERMHRKMSLLTLNPYEFLNLTYTYENIIKLIDLVKLIDSSSGADLFKLLTFDQKYFLKFAEYITDYCAIFNLNEIGKYGLVNITGSFFKKTQYKEIDDIQSEIDDINQFFKNECDYLSNIIEMGSDFVKLDNNERDGYFYYVTKKRSDTLVSKLSKETGKDKDKNKEKYEIRKFNGTNVKIVSDEITAKSNLLIELKDKIACLTKEQYLKTLGNFNEKYMDTFSEISKFIALIDINKCAVLCARKYKYNRPIIEDRSFGKSYFSAKSIRHPIIEIINEAIDYVKNDVSLIHEDVNGILLYGVNGAGKSSLSKAVGCNIIMAQMGFYVPSDEFIYYPYKKIFTRINGDDNIFKGMSSFAVEMDELRSILKYSDDRSIVLGDEICKGTEETSALSIVSSSIIRFCERNVNFIMATHFHKLYEMSCIKKLENIRFAHLSIICDKNNNHIIYGRKLEDGPGGSLYGIEIAEFIIEDDDFIKNAKEIRNDLLNKNKELLCNKTSNYNTHLYVDQCSICGVNGNCYPLDTHHIKEQYTFDTDDFNKDKLANIVVLCKEHHDMAHYGNLVIKGYVPTTIGINLDYEFINKEPENNIDKNKNNDINNDIEHKKTRKKYNEEHIVIIKDLSNTLKDNKEYLKVLKSELKKRDIIISSKLLNMILNNTY